MTRVKDHEIPSSRSLLAHTGLPHSTSGVALAQEGRELVREALRGFGRRQREHEGALVELVAAAAAARDALHAQRRRGEAGEPLRLVVLLPAIAEPQAPARAVAPGEGRPRVPNG